MRARPFARPIAAILLLAGAAASTGASADEAVVVDLKPSKSCKAKTAAPADPGEVAFNPAAFDGKCVSLDGYWRDLAIYPTRAEANQPDARSMSFLDRRRIGLYLRDRDEVRAPASTTPASLIGVVGNCARFHAKGVQITGYCHYKAGAYMVVSSVTLNP